VETILYVIIGLVVVATVAFLLLRRGKAQLQGPAPSAQVPAPPPKLEERPAKPAAPVAKREVAEPSAAPREVVQREVPPEREIAPAPKPVTPTPPPVVATKPGVQAPAPQKEKPAPKRDVAGIRKGLAATRGGFIAKLSAIFTGKKEIDPAILEQMEEVMLSSDVGVKTTHAILDRLRESLEKNELRDVDAVWGALRAEALRILSVDGRYGSEGTLERADGRPTVVLMVGVNGVGKTTTIGKLATRLSSEGKKVMLAAADTFRAAAVAQLEVWGKRVGAEVVKGKEGADPGAVAFEATAKSRDEMADLLLVDTAGRLHTKVPLMDEIKKVKRTIAKAMDGAPHETLLVLDSTTGQNALTQAAMFKEAVDLTGIILTKPDGTAKGGVVLGICDELKVPVRYIGLGERAEDLREFHSDEFVEALFGQREGDVAAA
jgi:fused signal recognition particle receptor